MGRNLRCVERQHEHTDSMVAMTHLGTDQEQDLATALYILLETQLGITTGARRRPEAVQQLPCASEEVT